MYNPIGFVQKNKDKNIKVKVFYFSLEMSKEQKLTQAISHRLFVESEGNIRVQPESLRSVRKAVDSGILDRVAGLKDYFDEFERSVTFIDSIKHPTGIFKFMEEYAKTTGKVHKKVVDFTNNETGETYQNEIFDYYEPYNDDEYVIIIVDHAALLSQENGLSLHQTINKLSSNYFVQLRNRYKYIPVLIQQQASSQESLDNMKADLLKPTLNGLGDCKLTQRDADVILGLFSPFRFRKKMYPESGGYDIMFFRDNIRFLEVIAAREGGSNSMAPLYFDGGVNYFSELPHPDTEALKKVRQFITENRKKY